MTPLRKFLKKIASWQHISWPGLVAIFAGLFAAEHIPYERLSVGRPDYLKIPLQAFSVGCYMLLLFQKRRRLGLYPGYAPTGENPTRWQAFRAKSDNWAIPPFLLLGIIFAAISAAALLMAIVFILERL